MGLIPGKALENFPDSPVVRTAFHAIKKKRLRIAAALVMGLLRKLVDTKKGRMITVGIMRPFEKKDGRSGCRRGCSDGYCWLDWVSPRHPKYDMITIVRYYGLTVLHSSVLDTCDDRGAVQQQYALFLRGSSLEAKAKAEGKASADTKQRVHT